MNHKHEKSKKQLNMKATMTICKAALAALFLMSSTGVMGQSLPAGTQLPPDPMGEIGRAHV